MSLAKLLYRIIKSAGTSSESDSKRDGFLSYSAETHSLAYGFGLGAAVALELAGIPFVLLITIFALGGVTAKRRFRNERVWREITSEPQYFLAALVLGFVTVGLLATWLGAGSP